VKNPVDSLLTGQSREGRVSMIELEAGRYEKTLTQRREGAKKDKKLTMVLSP
jgi:hypothetical protein